MSYFFIATAHTINTNGCVSNIYALSVNNRHKPVIPRYRINNTRIHYIGA